MNKTVRLLLTSLLLFALCSFTISLNRNTYFYQSVHIYKFVKYMNWGKRYRAIEIGVLGNVQAVRGLKKIEVYANSRHKILIVKHLKNIDDVSNCDILFLTYDQKEKFDAVAKKLENTNVLFITESPALSHKGSCINFVKKNGKMMYEIYQATVNNKGFKIPRRLLNGFAILI